MRNAASAVAGIGLLLSACTSASEPTAHFDLSGATTTAETFFDSPFPSDLRLTADGSPDYTGFPNPKGAAPVDNLVAGASDRKGFPTMLAVFFRFDGELKPRSEDEPIPAAPDSPILLLDIDPSSPERGRLFPTTAVTLPVDDYMPEFGLAVGPWPGVVLPAGRTFAAIVMRSAGGADGSDLGVAEAIAALARGDVPNGSLGPRAAALYAPMWETLDQLGIARSRVAVASIFSTGDVAQELYDISSAVVASYDVEVTGLTLDPDDGDHPEYCELIGTIEYPQFQRGEPPFNSDGLFSLGDGNLPVLHRYETAPVAIAIPKKEMPAGGFPLMIYFHGSGGDSKELIDLGKIKVPGGETTIGEGPAAVVAPHGIASASSALPLSPERLPGATAQEYINFANLRAMRDTFRQGVIEQRLYIEHLLKIEISPDALGDCLGPSLPEGRDAFYFNDTQLVALGLSMGGMYTNIISSVEPKIGALVPTGAGGFWNRFVLDTSLIDGVGDLLSIIFGSSTELSFMHPAMQLPAVAWEATEPIVYMSRLAKRPLPGHPTRHIYEPVGQGDKYFDYKTFDAAALSSGNRQVGQELWPTMQSSLALEGLDGFDSYPTRLNAESTDGVPFTGVVVQYAGDGLQDPHLIFSQLDDVKYQYGCFLETYVERGVPTVPAPAPLGTPCP